MKLRYYQPQERVYQMHATKYKWYDCGPPKLQYEEDGFWYDVEIVRESDLDLYRPDGLVTN